MKVCSSQFTTGDSWLFVSIKRRQSLTVIFQLITAGNMPRQSLPLASLQLMTASNILTKGLSAYIDQKTTMSASGQCI